MKSAKIMRIGEKINLYCSPKLENNTLYKKAPNRASVSAKSDVTQKNKKTTATIQFNDVSSNKGFILVFLVATFGFLVVYFLGLATSLFFRLYTNNIAIIALKAIFSA
jgi:hypothetical protein